MNKNQYKYITPLDTSNFENLVSGLATAAWPEFMLHDPVADHLWENLYIAFPEYQFALMDENSDQVIALANSLVLNWDADPAELPERGWDWAFTQAVSDYSLRLPPRTQCAIQIAIHPDFRNQRISEQLVKKMREIGIAKGFKRLIAPVRPNQKSYYPLINIDQYINWKNKDDLPFDAWLRVHVRAGAKIIKACHNAMEIKGSRADWEAWTSFKFPGSGQYIIPGGLVPMNFDLETNQGIYIEPNVWIVHDLVMDNKSIS